MLHKRFEVAAARPVCDTRGIQAAGSGVGSDVFCAEVWPWYHAQVSMSVVALIHVVQAIFSLNPHLYFYPKLC